MLSALLEKAKRKGGFFVDYSGTCNKQGFSTAIFSNSKKTAKKCAAYQAICKYYELTNDIAQYKCVGNKRIIEKDGRYIVEEAE